MGFNISKSFNRFLETDAACVFFHLEIIIDTFIMISGFLLIRSFLSRNKPVTIDVVIKRYFRLTFVPMVLILFTTQSITILTLTSRAFQSQWSNACDFHLTILGTGLFWLYQRNRSLGLKAFFIGGIASVVLPTLEAYRKASKPIPFYDLETLGDVRANVNVPTYLHSHLRSGPYFIGMAFGYLLSTYKPEDYKKRLVKWISIIIFALGFVLALFILMFGGYLAHRKYSAIRDALYVGTNRSIWSIGIGLIIVSCEYGNIPLISNFLRWPAFGPLSKLSYDAILTQGQNKITDSRVNEVLKNKKSEIKITPIDLLIEDLTRQQWTTKEMVCRQKVLRILYNVKNSTLWATWIWDSMQSPTGIFYGSQYQFGNYDQCMKAPWLETHSEYRTKYCLADVKLSNEEPQEAIVEPHSPIKSYINLISKHGVTFNTITWGVCVPVECNSKAISKIVRSLFKHTHLGLTIPISAVKVDPCRVAGFKEDYSVEHCLIMIIKAFCMKENMEYLYKETNDDISVMHGIRCLTSGIVVGLHVWFVTNLIGTINFLDVDKDTHKFHLNSVAHAELVVDTYLLMSGILLIKGLMSSNQYNPLLLILKRYLRFVWILGLLILLLVHVFRHNSDGPLWHRIAEVEIDICRKNWWLTLLMLGNYVDTANICYPILWTVPCDFHLSIVGIIIFWLFKKNRRVAFASFTVLLIAALIMPGIVTYQQKLPAVPPMDIRSIKDYRNILFKNPTYLWSHLRAGPYLVGLAVGYLMSIYKIDEYRNFIPKAYSLIGFIVSLGIAMQILVMGGIFQNIHRPYNVWEAALFASFNRTIWAIAIACLIAFCEYGTVPIIGAFLKSQMFLPLSKLSYGTYLLHTLVFSRVVSSTRAPLNHDMFLVFFHTFGVLVFCTILSLLMHLFLEAPMSKIINIVFHNKKNKNDCEMKEHECKNTLHDKQKKTL
ncbi:jg2034 [Pararge aegeria aegeria]|uniref:Jg2034 protein n=1 Tax=Pararge aegeria aegeria TaxID=348720 RepID=A0A8S4R378_9NEOP|nr:jg2034 [Pararge aegeria aegeria]